MLSVLLYFLTLYNRPRWFVKQRWVATNRVVLFCTLALEAVLQISLYFLHENYSSYYFIIVESFSIIVFLLSQFFLSDLFYKKVYEKEFFISIGFFYLQLFYLAIINGGITEVFQAFVLSFLMWIIGSKIWNADALAILFSISVSLFFFMLGEEGFYLILSFGALFISLMISLIMKHLMKVKRIPFFVVFSPVMLLTVFVSLSTLLS